MQPIKELSTAGRCAGRGCALIRQLADERQQNKLVNKIDSDADKAVT